MTPYKHKIPWKDGQPQGNVALDSGWTKYEFQKSEECPGPGWSKNGGDQWRKATHIPWDWRENTPFRKVLKLDGFYRGRSAAGLCFKDDAGVEYIMRIKCVVDFLERGTITNGITGDHLWAFVKQGANYSLCLVDA